MGGSTFAIGLVPGYDKIGFAAPVIILLLRLLQGLALGGEYGGAATYVAEHAPANRRGYFTSWIQTTATLGLFLSLGIILITRHNLDADLSKSITKFNDWGWRIPFLFSIILVGISIYIRLKMKESPLYAQIKAEGKTSVNPLKESFGHKSNLKIVLLALFGATMGQGVVWYTGQFYALTFIEGTCKVDFDQTRTILIWAILFATPFFVVFGRWSDKVGRKWIMMAGMLLAIVTYRPLFGKLNSLVNEKNKTEVAEKKEIKTNTHLIAKTSDTLRTMITSRVYSDGMRLMETKTDTLYATPGKTTVKPDIKVSKMISGNDYWTMVAIVFIMIIYVTMVYGPIAAFLVELFPTKIRYTSMSLPYHIGNGIFGGLTPFIALLLTSIHTDKLYGLWYPIIVAGVCLIIGTLYIRNRKDPDLNN
jgi:MFS family permease